jgi:hypothetical protein
VALQPYRALADRETVVKSPTKKLTYTTIIQKGRRCKHLNNKHVYLLPLPNSTKWVSWEHLKRKRCKTYYSTGNTAPTEVK